MRCAAILSAVSVAWNRCYTATKDPCFIANHVSVLRCYQLKNERRAKSFQRLSVLLWCSPPLQYRHLYRHLPRDCRGSQQATGPSSFPRSSSWLCRNVRPMVIRLRHAGSWYPPSHPPSPLSILGTDARVLWRVGSRSFTLVRASHFSFGWWTRTLPSFLLPTHVCCLSQDENENDGATDWIRKRNIQAETRPCSSVDVHTSLTTGARLFCFFL